MPHQLRRAAVMARLVQGRACLARNDLAGALGAFSRALASDPACGAAALNRAAVYLLAGDETRARHDCQALSGLGPDMLISYRDLDTPSALEHPRLAAATKALVRRRPSLAWAHVLNAFTLRGLMRYDEALVEADKALALEPASAALWALRSRLKLTDRGDFDGIKDLDKALSLEPRCGWLYCWRGEALRHQGNPSEALKALNRGLSCDPGYQQGYAWRGGVLRLLRRPRRAIEDLTRALRHDPILHSESAPAADQLSWALNQRMLCWRALGEYPRALRDLNRAHSLNPRFVCIYPASGVSEAAGSIESLIPLARRGTPSLQAEAWLGRSLHRSGSRERALRCYQSALKRYPSGWVWAWSGELLLELGQASEALLLLDRAVREEPRYSPAWEARARTRRALGELRGACADYTRALRWDPRCARAWSGRGECRRALGDRVGAVEDIRFSRAILHPRPPR